MPDPSSPAADAAPAARGRHRSLWQLVFLAAVFLAPVIAAWFWIPGAFVNHGTLIEPAVAIADMDLVDGDGNGYGLAELHGKWHLVHVAVDGCDAICRDSMYRMRQVRLAQGENLRRVENILVVGSGGADAELQTLLSGYPDLVVLSGTAPALERFLAPFRNVTPGAEQGRQIYIVDPLGNLMMRFPFSVDPGGLRKDLARLLRASRIG